MEFQGVVIGLGSFLVIGIFHPVAIKGEFCFGVRIWRWFLPAGLLSFAASLFCRNLIGSALLGVLSFTCFWSILEVFEQRRRVAGGWFPAGPSRRRASGSSGPPAAESAGTPPPEHRE